MTDQNKKTAALHNLGCKVNAYETEAMQQSLVEAGYEIVPFSEKADLYVINTCTVTNVADKKSRQMLHRARKLNPEAVVVAAGCYAQISPGKLREDPAVDIILGNNEKNDLVAAVREYEREKIVRLTDINEPGQPYEDMLAIRPAKHTRAFVKVQDGCNQFCSYCIIPLARGRARSRDPEQVVLEVEQLAENGFLEIVLTGIHLSSYGLDREDSLLDLIRRVNDVNGIRRIRLGSLEPGIITEEFAGTLAGMEKVCPHFHLSLQSGSDTVLARMNRRYTAQEYLEKCDILREHFGHPALTTDVIAGFPGETEDEFEETCAFVTEAAFSGIHVFPYSRREGTPAARMDGQIPGRTRQERAARLISISAGLKEEFERWYEGKQVEVLFEEPVIIEGKCYYEGFTPEYVKARFRSDESLRNRIMTVEFSR